MKPDSIHVHPVEPATKPSFVAPIVYAVALAAIVAVSFALPADGQTRMRFARFLGRFHPAVVHLPIGLLLLVPVLDLLGRRDAGLRRAGGVVLVLGAISTLVSLALGYLLARHDGFGGQSVVWHQNAGLLTAAAVGIAMFVRGRNAIAYVASLALIVFGVGYTGHLGGQLTHSESYLSEFAPRPIAWVFGPTPKRAEPPEPLGTHAPDSAMLTPQPALPSPTTTTTAPPQAVGLPSFRRDVLPMFVQSCVACHGEQKVKGGLRLDSFANLMNGGDSGAELTPSDPDHSELVRLMTLPPEDEDVMPPANHRPRPTAEQIAAVRDWIRAGAHDN